MKIQLAIAARRIGSAERWDALPTNTFDDAGEGDFLEIEGKTKKKKKSKSKRVVQRPLKGDVRTISVVQTTNRAP